MSPVPRSQAIGQQIAMLRKLRGMTQAELAQAAGVGKRTHVATEAGDRSPRDEELHKIADALAVPHDWLVTPDRYLPDTVELGPWLDCDVLPAHNVRELDAHGKVIPGPWGDGPDGGTPVQQALPLRRAA